MSAVDERLCLDAAGAADLPHLVEGQFPGEDDAVKAHVPQEKGPVHIVHRGLGGGVSLYGRVSLPEELQDGGILYDHRVRSGGRDHVSRALKHLQFAVQNSDIHGDVYLCIAGVAVGHRLRQRLRVEVRGVPSGIEVLYAEVNGVCAASDRGDELLHSACGGEDLRHGLILLS